MDKNVQLVHNQEKTVWQWAIWFHNEARWVTSQVFASEKLAKGCLRHALCKWDI